MTAEGERKYVAGFLFHKGRVLLVRKTHPKWQENMMNGVGGKMDDGEEATVAMVREFNEEAGLSLVGWNFFCTEYGPGYVCHFFRYTLPDATKYTPPKVNDEGEELEWCDPNNVKFPVIGNLHWLLQLAQDPRSLTSIVRTESDIRKIVTW